MKRTSAVLVGQAAASGRGFFRVGLLPQCLFRLAQCGISRAFYFKAEYVQELRDLRCGELREPQNYLAVIAKGDEVLDWHEMHARYQSAKVLLLEGGDHAISNFSEHLPAVMEHLGC